MSEANGHVDVDVSDIDRIHGGNAADRPAPGQFKGEAWVNEGSGIAYISEGDAWIQHRGLTEFLRWFQ